MISLLYCGNSRVFDGMLMSALSVAKHCTQPLDIHIATMDYSEKNSLYKPISQKQAVFIENQLRLKNAETNVTLHDMKDLFMRELSQSPNACTSYTPYTLLRLLVDLTDGMPEKILYLDTDTLALADIAELYNTDIAESDFAAALDYLGKFFINPRYMNAGVMLFNISYMKKSGLLVKARSLCREKHFAFPDQDVLNKCEKNKVFLPRRFNEQKRRSDDTVVRHFSKTIRLFPFFHTVNVKPWDEDGLHNIYKTHYYDDILSEYKTALKKWKEDEQNDQTAGCR